MFTRGSVLWLSLEFHNLIRPAAPFHRRCQRPSCWRWRWWSGRSGCYQIWIYPYDSQSWWPEWYQRWRWRSCFLLMPCIFIMIKMIIIMFMKSHHVVMLQNMIIMTKKITCLWICWYFGCCPKGRDAPVKCLWWP